MLNLPPEFYLQDTVIVARELLGKTLAVNSDDGVTAGIIIETEAYTGINDAACHSYKISAPDPAKRHRTDVMFRAGGCAYVYLIYGMYNCFNVVTRPSGIAEAVLIRALEPVQGIEIMKKRRNIKNIKNIKNLCDGPGKLCQALNITRDDNGIILNSAESRIKIYDNNLNLNKKIIATPRINVNYAGDDALLPYRFIFE